MKKSLIFLGVPLLAFYISTNWYQLMLIQGNSMAPSYKHLQMVLLNRHSRDYTYGDVVAFYSDELSCVLVKRIAACPGDTAVIKNGTLYVNDKVSEVFPQGFSFQYAGVLSQQAMLEPESYLVLGDNITESKDSRYPEVGFISDGKIIGKINGAETTAKLLSVRRISTGMQILVSASRFFVCVFTFDFEHFSTGAGHDEMNTMCCFLGSEIVNSFPKMTISDTKTIDIVHLVWYHRWKMNEICPATVFRRSSLYKE